MRCWCYGYTKWPLCSYLGSQPLCALRKAVSVTSKRSAQAPCFLPAPGLIEINFEKNPKRSASSVSASGPSCHRSGREAAEDDGNPDRHKKPLNLCIAAGAAGVLRKSLCDVSGICKGSSTSLVGSRMMWGFATLKTEKAHLSVSLLRHQESKINITN